MGGIMRRLFVLLGLMLVTVACCNGKRLWGMEVGKKEEKGEFESLLAQAAAVTGASADGDLGPALAMLKDIDMSKVSLSEICTYLVDLMIEVVQDPAARTTTRISTFLTLKPCLREIDGSLFWQQEFSEPGSIREILETSGLNALMGEASMVGPEKDDLLALLALEGNPVLYRTKYIELVDKSVAKLTKLRKDVSDPVKLRKMVKEALQAAGLNEENIKEVMELIENPALIAEQMEALLNDPVVMGELNRAMQSLSQIRGMVENEGIAKDEFIQMLTSFWEDPEFADTMQAKKMYAELMKDPELAQMMRAAGLGDVGGAPALGGVPAGGRVGGGIF